MKKIIAIIGPTASGKTSLGVALAEKFNGEIVSADSRQVYRGMDVGTGKDLQEYGNIPYHLIDVVDPNTEYNLAEWKAAAEKAIEDIIERGKLPIIVGGTGLYAQSLVENYLLPDGSPDMELRKEMENEDLEVLQSRLKELDPQVYEKMNNSDINNKRRLVRYIEKKMQAGSGNSIGNSEPKYETLVLGITWPREILCERIKQRLVERIGKYGMIEEVEKLHIDGVSWKRLDDFGLEYRFVSKFLQGEMTKEEMIEKLGIAIYQFAKRQMTWFRRWEKQGRKIIWVKDKSEAEEEINKFIFNI